MSDPLAYLPLAIAAAGGSVDGYEIARLVAAGHALLQRCGPLVRRLAGRRSGILLPTSPAFFTALAASDGRGAVLLNPLAAPAEIAYQLTDAEVGAVFTVAALASRLPADMPVVLLDESPRSARVILDGRTWDLDLGSHFGLTLVGDTATPGSEEECAVVYTSAMAGTPRGARLSHRNLLANARAAVEAKQLTPLDHVLALLPFSHLFGFTVTGTAPLLAGGRVTTVPHFHPARLVALLEQTDATILVGVPAIFGALLQALERRGHALQAPSLRTAICGGARLDPALQARFEEVTGIELRQGYGLTEAAPVCLFNRTDRPNGRGVLGVPMPGVAVRIADPVTNAPLPEETEGEIQVRGPNVFAGYVGDATDALSVHDGWLKTGDLGLVQRDGSVLFRGVRKAMFTRNGFNIYPRELERVVAAMPGAQAVRAFGEPDAEREHAIVLEVRGPVNEADVRAWCEAHLSAYKQPTHVFILPPG